MKTLEECIESYFYKGADGSYIEYEDNSALTLEEIEQRYIDQL